MKHLYKLTVLVFMLSMTVLAQNPIPNFSFENWAGGNPTDWLTSNVTGVVTNITQSSDAHTGSSAARGEVANFSGFPLPPSLISFSASTGGNFSVSQKYESLTGYYKLNAMGDEVLLISVEIYSASSMLIGTKSETFSAASNYTQFNVPVEYVQPGDAATARITFSVISQSGGLPVVGSNFHVDALELMGLVAIEPIADGLVPEQHQLNQNYPNPFNPNTTIEFSLSQPGHVLLTIYNALGQEVARLVDEPLAVGTYRANWEAVDLPGGTYFYRLQAGSFSETKKLVLAK